MKGKYRIKKQKGSIFSKLIGSYILFALIAVGTALGSFVVAVMASGGRTLQSFPGLSVNEDGTIDNLQEVYNFDGWVEVVDSEFCVTEVYGNKQTPENSYSPKQLIEATAFDSKDWTYQFGSDSVISVQDLRTDGQMENYHIFWQKRKGGYYLTFYPPDAFDILYNMDVSKPFVTNVGYAEALAVLLFFLLDLFAVSFFIFRKIKRPLDSLIEGMKRVENGEEQVELSMQTEREFVEIGQAFNHMTEQLHAQKAENEKMTKSRQRMLLELSHDIKTPVATIKSCACALREKMVPEEELDRYYETIALKAERVNTMSEELFTMLKMESADYRLELKPVDLAELVRRICAEYYGEITEAGFVFEIEIPEEQVPVLGDEKLLARVISNLLINAEKYNRTGNRIGVVLVLDNAVFLRVEDDGEEIASEVQDMMFTAFVRGESDRNSRGGTGLGLAIARAVMEKHGGSISYRRKGDENVFELRLERE